MKVLLNLIITTIYLPIFALAFVLAIGRFLFRLVIAFAWDKSKSYELYLVEKFTSLLNAIRK